jgi:DNA (cytosine-5)-methyltransferase 1
VFIVGHLGGSCPPEILLEPESIRGGTPPSRKERQKIAEVAQGGFEESNTGTGHWDGGVHPTLDAEGPSTSDQNMLNYPGATVVWDDSRVMMRGGGFSKYVEDDTASCLRAAQEHGTDVDLILEQPSNEEQPTEAFYEITPSLVVGTPSGNGAEEQLVVGASPQHEAFKKTTRGKGHADWAEGDLTSTLTDHDLGNDTFMQEMIVSSNTVIPRRLTPRECERLQGFPDDWTRYNEDGEEVMDGHRYRQMGNAVTVNVAQWIGERFKLYLSKGDER